MFRILASLAVAVIVSTPAFAFDGWHTENVTMLPSGTAGYDYITYDSGTKRLFLGHRHEGLQVFDPATHTLIKTLEGTPEHSANGALLIPALDLGISNNEDGTYIPFRLSTLAEISGPVKLSTGIDTSHYDPASKRILFNTDPTKDGTPVMVVDAATLGQVGTIMVPTRKAEGAVGDGHGKFFLAGQLESKIFVLDPVALKLVDTWSSPTCGKPTAMEVDGEAKRLFVACRMLGDKPGAFVVLDTDTGATVWATAIGDGTDGLAYDKATKRIFSTNGVAATLSVIEMTTPDSFKMVETLSTVNNAKVIAMDHENQKLYTMVAEGSADSAKKINLTVSPWWANTVFPNSFRVITFGK